MLLPQKTMKDIREGLKDARIEFDEEFIEKEGTPIGSIAQDNQCQATIYISPVSNPSPLTS